MWIRYAFKKLVRSFFVEKEIRKNKFLVSYKKLSENEYKEELISKFHEEALEVINSASKDELIEEIADCFDVIDEILKVNNITTEEIHRYRLAKKEARGQFSAQIFINYIQCLKGTEQCEWIEGYVNKTGNKEKYPITGEYVHHVVDFIITNEKGEVYIQKRSENVKSYPGAWEIPGGKLEKNENFEDCIKRELKEELNLELGKINELILDTEVIIKETKCAYSVFYIDVKDWLHFELEAGQATEFKWISEKDISILITKRKDGTNGSMYEAVNLFFAKNRSN